MGRKNKRKKAIYTRRVRTNPKQLISEPNREYIHTDRESHSDWKPHRGDIWFAELGRHPGTSVQEGCRPIFVISNNTGNLYGETITVIPLTSRMKKEHLPTHVFLSQEDGPTIDPSMVLAEQLTTIGKNALRKYVGRVEKSKISEIEDAVYAHLGLKRRL